MAQKIKVGNCCQKIDTSVLLENTPLVTFFQNHIQDWLYNNNSYKKVLAQGTYMYHERIRQLRIQIKMFLAWKNVVNFDLLNCLC